MPRIVDAEVVKARPQLGVLSALAHRQSAADLPVLRAVSEGLGKSELSEKMVSYWWDVIWDDMGRGAQEAWEKFMQVPDNYEYKSDFARKYFGQGRHEAQRAAVLEVLDVRRIAVPPDARARIEACADSAQLKEWHRRAIFANSVEDLFSGASISVG